MIDLPRPPGLVGATAPNGEACDIHKGIRRVRRSLIVFLEILLGQHAGADESHTDELPTHLTQSASQLSSLPYRRHPLMAHLYEAELFDARPQTAPEVYLHAPSRVYGVEKRPAVQALSRLNSTPRKAIEASTYAIIALYLSKVLGAAQSDNSGDLARGQP